MMVSATFIAIELTYKVTMNNIGGGELSQLHLNLKKKTSMTFTKIDSSAKEIQIMI